MRGDAEGTFRPNDTVSVDEVITVLIRALGYTEADLDKSGWPASYINKAREIGLINYDNYSGDCTRGQAAALVARMLELPQVGEEQLANQNAAFTYDYGVVTELTNNSITISSFKGGAHSYKLAAECDWQTAAWVN